MTEGSTHRHSIRVRIKRETPGDRGAYLIDAGGDGPIWMPKSQCEMYARSDGSHDMTADVWILKEKGLV